MDKPKVAFLMSAPYSGATLLSILINQHQEISSDGEIFPYVRGGSVLCSCGKTQAECTYYRKAAKPFLRGDDMGFEAKHFYYVPEYSRIHVISRAFEGFWSNGILHKIRNSLCQSSTRIKTLEDRFLQLHTEFYYNSLKIRNATLYFDGTKSVRRIEFFLEKGFPSQIIYLIRDPRAFCNSYIKNKKILNRDLEKATTAWKKSIKKLDVLKNRFPELKILVVKYDQLCKSPAREFERISNFFGLEFKNHYMTFSNDDMHILGNRMRFKFDGIIKEDISWKTQLGKNERHLIESSLRNQLDRFNFEN